MSLTVKGVIYAQEILKKVNNFSKECSVLIPKREGENEVLTDTFRFVKKNGRWVYNGGVFFDGSDILFIEGE